MSRRDRKRRPARRPQLLEPRERILVLCEGENTEPQYIHGFRRWCRNPLVEIVIPNTHGVPLTLVREAKKLRDDAQDRAKREHDDFLAYDQVWCVFDIDEHPHLSETLDMAKGNNIELAISNPCFELWLVLHFRDNPGAQHRHAVQSMMKTFVPNYDKKVDFSTYASGYRDALARARRLAQHASEDEEPHRNPTTGVFLLTQLIGRYFLPD
jgi:hypothetical protein